jgi:membrane protein YqaA with SNARE-associated domain
MSARAAPASFEHASAPTNWAAFAWGFAEAVIFFIVPDVLLTRVALRDGRRALVAALWTTAGALLGGTALWFAASQGAVGPLFRTFSYLPGIHLELIAQTGQALHGDGLRALLIGGLIGQPYKLFAVHAGAQHVALPAFLAASAVARLVRFSATALIAWLAGRGLRDQPNSVLTRLHLLVWAAFYLIYFITMR